VQFNLEFDKAQEELQEEKRCEAEIRGAERFDHHGVYIKGRQRPQSK
jgi:hypothetical protein